MSFTVQVGPVLAARYEFYAVFVLVEPGIKEEGLELHASAS